MKKHYEDLQKQLKETETNIYQACKVTKVHFAPRYQQVNVITIPLGSNSKDFMDLEIGLSYDFGYYHNSVINR